VYASLIETRTGSSEQVLRKKAQGLYWLQLPNHNKIIVVTVEVRPAFGS